MDATPGMWTWRAMALVAFKGVPFQPSQGGSGNQATGTFTLTGQLVVDDISQPLPTD